MSADPPSPPDLSQTQKEDLDRTWKTHARQLVDVRASAEANTKTEIGDHTYRFLVRLHAFFSAVLAKSNRQFGFDETCPGVCDYVKDTNDSCLVELSNSVFSSSDHSLCLVEGRKVASVHYEDFLNELNHFELKGEAPTDEFVRRFSFGAFLYHMPDQALPAVGSALSLAMATLSRKTNPSGTAQLGRFLDGSQWALRFYHVRPQVPMMDIRTGLAYKFLTIKGHVVKARPKRLRVVTGEFACSKCGALVTHAFVNGRYSLPTKCVTLNCRSKNFSLVRPTARYINAQELRLQEAQEESTKYAGRTPRQMEVEVTHDLVDSCRPGDVVLVACIVQAINSAVAEGKAGKRALETSTYKLYLQAHSITTTSESRRRDSGQPTSGATVVYTQQQLQSITQLAHADHRYFGMVERRAFPFDLLVRSLCPSIIGHDTVKAGLLLCLLGGTPPDSHSSDKANSIRSNSHMLIVGDPGMGKSQMLLAATQIAARSVYVGGNTSSTTGLTVSLTKEQGGETGIEAGALVLADQGVCCIDEFDKMAKTHQDGLLETMEQQQISIAKAGVVASLPARCSVIAAANPKHGSYNMGKTVAENLNMATPILSRFDLVFILRDQADQEQDRMVSSNIMNLYRNSDSTKNQPPAPQDRCHTNVARDAFAENRMSLMDRLRWVTDIQKEPLPAELVRDYVSYAREYCKPKLSQDAAAVLKEYFMNLRYPADGSPRKDAVPLTTRQLEALIRLSQARAKACLREYVLKEDAMDVVELMTQSNDQVHSDEFGTVDRSRGGAGGKSNRKMKKAFVNELHRIVGPGAECSLDDLRRIADKVNCGLQEFPSMIENMRHDGILMKKAVGSFKVLA